MVRFSDDEAVKFFNKWGHYEFVKLSTCKHDLLITISFLISQIP
jgi:hypothetical protein